MLKERCVFLFGAGATLPWGSPLTSELTELILDSGFKIKGNKKTITRFIYESLVANGFKPSDINFETIINVIEELIVFYGYFNHGEHYENNELPSLLSCFFKSGFEKKLLNYTIKGGEIKHGYQLQIPANVDYDFGHYALHGEPPAQFFFQHLLTLLLSEISSRISKYAYHSSSYSKIDHESEISKLFVKWMELLNNRNVLRIYTLNYERLFKILLDKVGIHVFEGFDSGEIVDYSSRLRANVKRILSDFDSNIHYNLHGSAFWEVLDLDREQLPNPEIILTGRPHLPVNNSPATIQVEKGKTMMVTNIVTGYQKAQKGRITPFKQMQAAFDRDSCFASHIYIIGYSMGDEHINESIKSAIRHNPEVKIIIVDPFFLKNQKDLEIALRYFPYSQMYHFAPKNVSENMFSYLDGNIVVYTLSFEDFIKEQVDPTTRLMSRLALNGNSK